MLSKKRTTFVLLERNTEAPSLVAEIKDLQVLVGMGESLSTRDFFFRFPMLTQLRQGLEDDLSDDS